MADITFRSDMGVLLVDSMASDRQVIKAARISTSNNFAATPEATKGLIGYLMKNRHGTPFEHNSFTFRIECPIFVAREFMRHRIGMSYNEESARYKQLAPVFWVPPLHRGLVQAGSSAHPDIVPGTPTQSLLTREVLKECASHAYEAYEYLLSKGIAREVARSVLPVSVFTSFYVTCNARSLMNFLSLRVDSPDSRYETKPQREIQEVAQQMEEFFAVKMPVTCDAFNENGRVAP